MRKAHGLVRHAADLVKDLLQAKGGGTAIIFALSSVTLLSAAGIGIDLARGMMVKARLATALDASALAVGNANGLDKEQMESLAQKYFNANYPETELGAHGLVAVTPNGQHISLTVTGSMPTSLLQIMGIDNLDFTVTNEVTRAVTKLRVALVLDNTGSMSGTDVNGTSKISALKTATHQLLTQLRSAAVNPGDVQVAIIPFALDVNMGTAIADKDWIDWSDFDRQPPNTGDEETGEISETVGPGTDCPFGTNIRPYGYGCLYLKNGQIETNPDKPDYGRIYPGTDNGNYNPGRRGHRYNGYFSSEPAEGATCATTTRQDGVKSTTCTRYTHKWVRYNHAARDILPLHGAWTGCFMDRDQNYDTNSNTPSPGTAGTLFPAEINDSCPPVTMSGLGYDWSSLNSKVDQMTPNGSTNQTIGLAWGWQALTTGNPLNAPAQDPTIQNVVVLLSDGMNTQDRWYGDGANTSPSVDNRMATACANAKEAKVRIYTVLVMAGNSATLKGCATDPQKYFSLNTAGAMVTAFNTIGTELANLHLSH